MNREEFLKLLANHDWYYSFSDDHRVWRKGQNERNEILEAMSDNEELKEVYSQYLKDHNL